MFQVRYKLPKSSLHRRSLSRLRGLRERLMEYSSATEFVLSEGCHTKEE